MKLIRSTNGPAFSAIGGLSFTGVVRRFGCGRPRSSTHAEPEKWRPSDCKHGTVNGSATDRDCTARRGRAVKTGPERRTGSERGPPAARRLPRTATSTSQTKHRPRRRTLQGARHHDDDRGQPRPKPRSARRGVIQVDPRRAHSRFPGAVCRQRWTVRLGEVEPVFGQTGRVLLDITARTAHDGALKWTRPSTPRAARSILATFPSTCALPSGGRWSLRRVLQRPGRQRKRSSAKSSCGSSRTSSSAPSSPPCCNARCAPPRLATRRAPSCATCPGGCGATAWRRSTFAPPGARRCRSRRRTTARNTPVGRSGGRDSTPPWWCWASTTGARRSWPRMQAARSPCTARWPKRRRSSAPTASPWISRPSARPPIATLRGPERPSRARRAACWTA